jgi:ribonuclease D
LDKLVERFLGVKLEKGPQRANWARRPLTQRMVAYAHNDARHLKPLADRLATELEERNRLAWHGAMCARLVKECSRPNEVDPDAVWRLGGAHRLDRRGLAVLRELWHWRDAEARRLCRPPYFVLPHEMLVALAERAGRKGDVDGVLPRKLPSARRASILAALKTALELPEAEWPTHRRNVGVRLTTGQRARQLRLQARRDQAAEVLGIEPSLIASRAALVRLAAGQMDPARELMDWQQDLLFSDDPIPVTEKANR